ncbi:MAG TPA: DUF4388 domain-containing protein [Ktedonobacterales bacterium]
MPLAGSLTQYRLPDVLRVIESGQRGGRLTVRRGERSAAIYFSGGQWLMCERIGSVKVLAHHLARAGFITPQQFEATVGVPFAEAGQIPDIQVVRALITSRQLTQEQLRAFAEADALDLLSQMLNWQSGDFAFEDGVPLPPGRVALPLPVSKLVSTALQVAPAQVAREVAPIPREATIEFAEVDPLSRQAIQLTPDQWRLLTKVDGHTPLWAIARTLQAPDQAICRLAGELVAAGTVVIVGRAPVE